MNWNRTARLFFLSSLIFFLFQSCGFYSLNGSAYDPNLYSSFSVQNIVNNSGQGPPDLTQRFTEDMRDYFQQNTQLSLVNFNGDVQFDGAITRYNVAPAATVEGDQATLNRLTIEVSINYTDMINDVNSFENQKFSYFADFDPGLTVTDVEDRLIEEIFDQIILDIFNKTATNW